MNKTAVWGLLRWGLGIWAFPTVNTTANAILVDMTGGFRNEELSGGFNS